MPRSYGNSTEGDFVTGTTKQSRMFRHYNKLTSLSPLNGITLLIRA